MPMDKVRSQWWWTVGGVLMFGEREKMGKMTRGYFCSLVLDVFRSPIVSGAEQSADCEHIVSLFSTSSTRCPSHPRPTRPPGRGGALDVRFLFDTVRHPPTPKIAHPDTLPLCDPDSSYISTIDTPSTLDTPTLSAHPP